MLSGHFPLSLQVKANGTGNQASKDGCTPTEMARFSTCQTSSRTTTVLGIPAATSAPAAASATSSPPGPWQAPWSSGTPLPRRSHPGCRWLRWLRRRPWPQVEWLTNWRCRFLTKDINRELRKSRHPSPFELTLARNICSPVIWTDRRPLGGRPTLVPGHSFAANVSERVCRCAQHLATFTNFGDLPTSSY